MYSYDPNILRKLQLTELEILKKLDELCEKYGIEYFVAFGSLIGAVRHQGFIPWDDDIDVGMTRADYEKLKSIPAEEWGEFVLSDSRESTDYPAHVLIYPQIYKKGTIFQTAQHYQRDKIGKEKFLPIWLDIFIYEFVSSVEDAKKKAPKARLYRKLLYYSRTRANFLKEDNIKTILYCILRNGIHTVLSLNRNVGTDICSRYIKLMSGEGDYITTFDTAIQKEIIRSVVQFTDIYPTVRVPFENITVRSPANADKVLRQIYGDYMQLPPEDKRINHPPMILDFGDGKGNTIKNE